MPIEVEHTDRKMRLVGLFLLIISALGLVMCATLPWFSVDEGGEKDNFHISEFDDNFDDRVGFETAKDYYLGSALLSVVGYLLILILSIFMVIDPLRKVMVGLLSKIMFRSKGGAVAKGAKKGAFVLFALVTFIPAAWIAIGGARFIGLCRMTGGWELSLGGTFGGFSTSLTGADISYHTPAGWAALLIGLTLVVLAVFLVMTQIRGVRTGGVGGPKRHAYASRHERLVILVLFLCVLGLIFTPMLAFLKQGPSLKSDLAGGMGEDYSFEVTGNLPMNDGLIHIAETSGGGDLFLFINMFGLGIGDDIVRSLGEIDNDIALMKIALIMMILFSIVTLIGIMRYRAGKTGRSSHIMISMVLVTIFSSFLLFTGYGLLVGDTGRLGVSLTPPSTEGMLSIEWVSSAGSSYIPLIFGILALVLCFMALRHIWPVSTAVMIGRRKPEAPPAPVEAGTTEPSAEGGEAGGDGVEDGPRPSRRPSAKGRPNITIIAVIIAFIVIIGVAGAVFMRGGGDEGRAGGGTDSGPLDYHDLEMGSDTGSDSSFSPENSEYPVIPTINTSSLVTRVTAELTWTDDADRGVRYTNEPDNFALYVITNEGDIWESPMVANDESSKQGSVSIDTGLIDPPVGWGNESEEAVDLPVAIIVVCGDCGNQVPNVGLLQFNDGGNTWDLSYEVEFYIPPE